MRIYGRRGRFLVAGALWALTGSIASAQTGGGPPGGAPATSASVSAGYLHEFGAAVSGGGDFRVSRAFAGADVASRAGSKTVLGLGQISGPAVAGVLAERTGSFSGSFYMAAAFAGVAILLSAFLRKPQSG